MMFDFMEVETSAQAILEKMEAQKINVGGKFYVPLDTSYETVVWFGDKLKMIQTSRKS
jgi:hypothetical protein